MVEGQIVPGDKAHRKYVAILHDILWWKKIDSDPDEGDYDGCFDEDVPGSFYGSNPKNAFDPLKNGDDIAFREENSAFLEIAHVENDSTFP